MRLPALLVIHLLGALAGSLSGCALDYDPGASMAPSPMPSPVSPDAGMAKGCATGEVHAIGVYQAGPDPSVAGDAIIFIERPGQHVLALSAYATTRWHVALGLGVQITAVQLIGFGAQTLDLPGVPVTRSTGCGYSYPYNGSGCDTNKLLSVVANNAGAPVSSFHGCYESSQWTLHADGSMDSSCDPVSAPQQGFGSPSPCVGSGSGG